LVVSSVTDAIKRFYVSITFMTEKTLFMDFTHSSLF